MKINKYTPLNIYAAGLSVVPVLVFTFITTVATLFMNVTVNAQGVGINSSGNPPDPSAILDASSTSKGTLITRMTTAQRDVIINPAEGLQIFNITTKCLEIYIYNTWQNVMCGVCPPVAAPTAGTHSASQTQITWNWNTVSGAVGYKWNTSNNYAGATDNSINTSYTQSGLICGTSYTLYVWAYSSCGSFASVTLTQTTSACPFNCGTSTVSHGSVSGVSPVSGTYTYNTASGNTYPALGAGKCWITKNVGATAEATSPSDADAGRGGWFFQFNRLQGYYHDGSGRTPNTAWPSLNETSNWTQANDPCNALFGSTWRLPTQAEWSNYRSASTANGGMNNGIISSAYNSPLKLHSAGYLNWTNGVLADRGVNGYYWNSTQNASATGSAIYIEGASGFYDFAQSEGFTIRCIKD